MSRLLRAIAAPTLLCAGLAACSGTPAPDPMVASHPEGAIFDPASNAMAEVDAALARAGENSRMVLVMLGANWCHDSRALASHFMDEPFASLIAREFELVHVNIGLPQTGDGHNLDVATRFGVEVEGTPTLLLLDAGGNLLNTPEDAVSWRNADSRSAEEILAWLEAWLQPAG